jgi:hypothetical protein
MRPRVPLGLLLIIALLSVSMMAFAQDDETDGSPMDNACHVGGSMEGKCNLATEDQTLWAWTCGWYIARVDAGVWGAEAVPDWCNYAVTGDVVVAPRSLLNVCLDGAENIDWLDMMLIGPLDTLNNIQFYLSEDGSCSIGVWAASSSYFIVTANTQAEAFTKCQSLGGNVYFMNPLVNHFPVPSDWYLCIR